MDPAAREKYSRQILFPPLGEEGQERLLRARAVILGCGALGSFHANALARAGVGEIVIIDRDYVEPSNLQRQWLFDEADAAEALPKAVAAARKLQSINSAVRVEPVVADLVPQNAEELLLPAGVILDGTDNFEARYLLNDVAVKHGVPWIYGAAVASEGFTMPILPGVSACLACLFPTAPSGAQPTCDTAGVLNAVTAAVASLQVADALKILSGNQQAVEPRLLAIDVWRTTYRSISTVERNPA
ncbi:MAG: ThiF family adenylyltransferase, partial [Acidobacteria bacterium]|nr:ThiF family adenylyltransferase [Acidobacteriota bacterium]